MKKKEFLTELENSLEGRITSHEIKKIISNYDEIFEASLSEGKNENLISDELGSPAKIARTVLKDSIVGDISKAKQVGNKVEVKLSGSVDKIYDKVTTVDERINTTRLSSMGKRTGAYLLDGIVLCLIISVLIFFIGIFAKALNISPLYGLNSINENGINYYGHRSMANPFNLFSNFFPFLSLMLIFGVFNVPNAIILWVTNGFTLGKWIFKIRVIKIDGTKIKFWNAVLRELLIKSVLNTFLSGFLNLFSLIWGFATPDHKTAHDLLASTKVINSNDNDKYDV